MHPHTSTLLGILLLLAPLSGCTSEPATTAAKPNPGRLSARSVDTAPVIDGDGSDAAWQGAARLQVPMEGPAGNYVLELSAVVCGDDLHMLARWPDSTEDRAHKLWTPKGGGGFGAGAEREDVLAFGFPISGEFTGDMLSATECTWDVWQWKSARTDPAGFAMDKSHTHSFADPGGKRGKHDLSDGTTLYIVRPEDAGESATKSLPEPAGGSGPAPHYEAVTPTGSAADVRAKGSWSDGWWTVELRRKLSTGHPDDAHLVRGGDGTPFAVAILDRAEDEDHAASKVHVLFIEP